MTQASSVIPLSRIPLVSPSQVKSAALNDIPYAQLSKKYDTLLSHLAGPLTPRVLRVFGHEHAPLYILTDPARRQVWNACLAAEYPEGDMAYLRRNFLMERSKHLLEDAFGSVPDGFQGLLRRAGETGHDPNYYTFWHDHLTHFPEDFAYVSGRLEICADLTEALMKLPAPLRRLRIYKCFKNMRDLTDFVTAMTAVHGGTPSDEIWDDIREQLYAGQSPLKILLKIVDAVPCPPPFITGDDRFRHLGSVKALKSAGLKFHNCLRSAFMIKDVIRGPSQCYEFLAGDEPCMVGLTTDGPFGCRLDDIRGLKNKCVSDKTQKIVEQALAEHGIVKRRSVIAIAEDWEERYERSDDTDFSAFDMDQEDLIQELALHMRLLDEDDIQGTE
ncbi:hypothetical protein M3N55_12200 [Roseibaca sp. V10]|uniref:Uncharacterized protein n=1 Tax=Roseinatronobacter domitianus TaxID=2940293 RepID=A0ABT0M3Q6_9RHOB|nr:hypothetical protein [Roseibaca domitiana]MCL1629493.1 hypothetical protein [Roseibaca domitiana]